MDAYLTHEFMQDQKEWNRVIKNLSGEETLKEKNEFLIWFNENESHKKLFEKIKILWEQPINEECSPTFLSQFTKMKFKRLFLSQLVGNFVGFAIAFSATRFFSTKVMEKKSFKNLFGLIERKQTVVNSIPEWVQWVLTVVAGFIVFEFVNHIIQTKKYLVVPIFCKKILKTVTERQNDQNHARKTS
ncbi:hypothetical protein BH10BAC1_BH10BAC1_11880 [soil metagenome]